MQCFFSETTVIFCVCRIVSFCLLHIKHRNILLFSNILQYHHCPFRDDVGIYLLYCAIGSSEKEFCLVVFYRVVIEIGSVHYVWQYACVIDWAHITGDNFRNWHIMSALHHTFGYARGINGRWGGADEEQTDKIPLLFCPVNIIHLALTGQDRLKYQIFMFLQ